MMDSIISDHLTAQLKKLTKYFKIFSLEASVSYKGSKNLQIQDARQKGSLETLSP